MEIYKNHIAQVTDEIKAALTKTGYAAVAIHAGRQEYYRADDREILFKPYPHFARFTPTTGPGHIVLVTLKDAKPTLIEYRPSDYWYEQGDSSDTFWRDALAIVTVTSTDDATRELLKRTEGMKVATLGAGEAEPTDLVALLDHSRSIKTEYEINCIAEANKLAAPGHTAARDAFLNGRSEYEIYNAYLAATGLRESELPYNAIVALNEKAATLHYQRTRKDVTGGAVLLIDAGASVHGYASDITRTYASPGAPQLFKDILASLESLQKSLAAKATPGTEFIDLHDETHRGIATLLKDVGVIMMAPDEAIESGLTRAFLPHGLGHMLGLQVHDVGNRSAEGSTHPLTKRYPKLRTNKKLGAGNVTTIEPGIYFIPSLLAPFASSLKNLDTLLPCGGIRIEDNIVVASAPRNLTREVL